MNTLGQLKTTSRGFPLIEFKDSYDHPCSLQISSIADYPAIWLGPDEAKPKILASKAHLVGVETKETTGWVDYPVPDDVLMTTRMHLNQDQVAALIQHLQAWLDTGDLEKPK